jgi:hypothetical protein
VFSDRQLVKDDIIALRRTFAGNDDGYAEALAQTALEITRALRNPRTHGEDLEHDLAGWRRSKYRSSRAGEADMRLVFRARPKQHGLELLVFAHRRGVDADGRPTTAYHLGAKRQAVRRP